MRNKNYYINLNDREYLDVLSSLMNKRNKLIQSGKYTDGIDEVIMKIKKATPSSILPIKEISSSALSIVLICSSITIDGSLSPQSVSNGI